MRDWSGTVFGYVTIIGPHFSDERAAQWVGRCVCGTEIVATISYFRVRRTMNCGCQTERLMKERHRTHGHTIGKKSPTFLSWDGMIQRTTNPNNAQFTDYGGRGIKPCPKWLSFQGFLEDMGERPDEHTLERVDVDGPYSKENCRWLPIKDQNRNKRNTVWVEWQGEKVPLRELSERYGLDRSLVLQRYRHGWTMEQIFLGAPRPKRVGQSGVPGVSRHPSGKWAAGVYRDGKRVYLGLFSTVEDAAAKVQAESE